MAIANVLNQNDQTPQPAVSGADWNFTAVDFTVSGTGNLQLVSTGVVSQFYTLNASPDFQGDPAGFFNISGGTFIFNAQKGCILQSQGGSGGNMIIQAVTNDVLVQSLAGAIKLEPFTDLYATLAPVASFAAAPATTVPAGYAFVVRETATGKLFYLN